VGRSGPEGEGARTVDEDVDAARESLSGPAATSGAASVSLRSPASGKDGGLAVAHIAHHPSRRVHERPIAYKLLLRLRPLPAPHRTRRLGFSKTGPDFNARSMRG
jgi:hypothetical protein